MHLIGLHKCEVFIYWRRVTRGVPSKAWSNGLNTEVLRADEGETSTEQRRNRPNRESNLGLLTKQRILQSAQSLEQFKRLKNRNSVKPGELVLEGFRYASKPANFATGKLLGLFFQQERHCRPACVYSKRTRMSFVRGLGGNVNAPEQPSVSRRRGVNVAEPDYYRANDRQERKIRALPDVEAEILPFICVDESRGFKKRNGLRRVSGSNEVPSHRNEEIWAALNCEVLRANEGDLKASHGTIPTSENPVTRPGIKPGSPLWDASRLTVQPPWPLSHSKVIFLQFTQPVHTQCPQLYTTPRKGLFGWCYTLCTLRVSLPNDLH
ncbi:hypothetical protein PR048_001251 [Dryococelus australis]|uniref:Uncharacterized protein n=1 Tax=Dryococelus australis TaxID=614101 RepID=A0ABQ9IHT7_9NEOP|nr:hypothetical protein PR048_001251 [Dryococelus australis]